MTIKWKMAQYAFEGDGPLRIDVVKETAHFVTIRRQEPWGGGSYESREKKDGLVFNTWEEARDAMMKQARLTVRHKEADWQRAKDRLQKISQLKKPKESEGEG